MTAYDFFEARHWVDDYKNTTGGAKAYVAHQLANAAAGLLAAIDAQADKIERRRIRLVEAENDLLNVRGILSPNGYPRRLPDDVALVPNVAPAVKWLADRVDELTAALTEARAHAKVPLGYIVLLYDEADDCWTDDWDGTTHRGREAGLASLAEATKAGYKAVLTEALPIEATR